jgi:hypothetical protein
MTAGSIDIGEDREMANQEDVYRRNFARDVEKLAVATLRQWVGSRGELLDESETARPDFLIRYHDGRKAVGEIGTDTDPVIEEMWQTTFRQEEHQTIRLPDGYGQWGLRLRRGANIKKLHQELQGFIDELLQHGLAHLEPEYLPHQHELRKRADDLGLEHIARATEWPDSYALYFFGGSGGTLSADPDVIVNWIEQLLADPRYRDTTSKLLAVDDVDERHIFMMANSGTPFEVEARLQRVSESLPHRPPVLAHGISHLWLVARFTDPAFGTFAAGWNSTDGWMTVPVNQ